MRHREFAAGMLALVMISGCGGGGSGSDKAGTSSRATATAPSPDVAGTYVPADGDPKTHILEVTIRDVGGVETYEATAQGCVPIDPPGTAVLAIFGPTAELDFTPLKDVKIPPRAQPVDGACEAKLTVTVPYAPRYSLGVAKEGHGIATGDEPAPDWITTRGRSQKVTVLSQVVTTLR